MGGSVSFFFRVEQRFSAALKLYWVRLQPLRYLVETPALSFQSAERRGRGTQSLIFVWESQRQQSLLLDFVSLG